MGFPTFVQQDHAVRLAPNCFSVNTPPPRSRRIRRGALSVENVSLPKFAHIDGDDVLLATVKRLGKCQAGFGFATPEGPQSINTPIGLLGLSRLAREVCTRLAIIVRA